MIIIKNYRSWIIKNTLITMTLAIAGLEFVYAETPQEISSSYSTVIEEVIVNATKRDATLQETGISISVMDQEEMAFRDINSLEDIQTAVPGLHVGEIVGTPLINIRGIGLNLLTGLGQPGVATHYDGVYIPRNGATTTATVDLSRVEVLRGPQGTLYGRNATGGSVNFIGKRPSIEGGQGLTVGAGNYGREFYEAYIEGPVFSDDLALRVYAKRDRFDGYGENEASGHSVGDNDAFMARIALTYELDSMEIYSSYSYRSDEGHYPYASALSTVSSLLGVPYPLEDHTFKPHNTKLPIEPESEKSTHIANLTITWDFDAYTIKSISGYVAHDREEFYSAVDVNQYVSYLGRDETSDAWSQEFNLTSESFDGRLNWLVGLYYSVDDGATPLPSYTNLDGLQPVPGTVMVLDPTSETETKSKAAFLDGSWSLLDSLRILFGVRYSKDSIVFDQNMQQYLAIYQDPALGTSIKQRDFQPVDSSLLVSLSASGQIGPICNDTYHYRKESTDPKFGIEWDVTPNMLLYAQYQTGYKAGGFDTNYGCSETFEPEQIEAYEVGMKLIQMDGSLTLNAALFDYAYEDFQVQQVKGFGTIIVNAPEASSQGVELEVTYKPVPWLEMDAEYSYLDAQYDKFESRDGYKNSSSFVVDAPVEDLSGNRMSRSPKHTLSSGATFFVPVHRFGIGMAQFRLEAFYSDELYFREFNSEQDKQDSYTLYNVFVTMTSEDEKFRLGLFGKNLSDEEYLVGLFPMNIVKYRGGYYGPPRTYGASFSMSF